jgi:hypothetical protein
MKEKLREFLESLHYYNPDEWSKLVSEFCDEENINSHADELRDIVNDYPTINPIYSPESSYYAKMARSLADTLIRSRRFAKFLKTL